MGRVKLQIKRIENTTNRQVTFSKRRNGLIKKAYELSVLCDVDLALIMFSPAGRLSLFSGNKSVEQILARYIDLPEHDRGRLHNKEFLKRALGQLSSGEANQTNQAASSTVTVDSHLEELQQDISNYKSQIQNMEKRLRIFEGDPSEITTLYETEYRERILKETLDQVRRRKQIVEEKYNSDPSISTPPSTSQHQQAHLGVETTDVMNSFVTMESNNNNILELEWLPQRDVSQVQILNFLDSNGLLPLRDHQPQHQCVVEMLSAAPSSLFDGNNIDHDHIIRTRGDGCLEDDDNVMAPQRPHQFGQVIDVNLSPWAEFYPTGGNGSIIPAAQPRGRELLDLYLSQFTPSTMIP